MIRLLFVAFVLSTSCCLPSVDAQEKTPHKKQVLFSSCDAPHFRVNKVSLVFQDSFPSRKRQVFELSKEKNTFLSTGYERTNSEGRVFVKNEACLSQDQINKLLFRIFASLSNCSFELYKIEDSNRAVLRLNDMEIPRNRISTVVSLRDELLIPYRYDSIPFEDPSFGMSISCFGVGSWTKHSAIEITTDSNLIKIGCSNDLPCSVQIGDKSWDTYDMTLEAELESIYVAAGLPRWIQAKDHHYWQRRIQRFSKAYTKNQSRKQDSNSKH